MLEESMIVDPCTMKMALRKGDSGSAYLWLNEEARGSTFWFVVKESIHQPDEEAPILQKYEHDGGQFLEISISELESDKLSAGDNKCPFKNTYKDYIWALKYVQNIRNENGEIIDTGRVRTLVPHPQRKPPIFRVYPEIIRGPHDDLKL